MLRYLTRDQVALPAALVLPPAVCALLLPFRDRMSNTNAALVLVVVVVAVAVLGHRPAGALAALSAAVWFDFFLTRPYERFAITKSADIVTAVLLLAVGIAVSQLAARTRELKVIAITDDDYLAQIHHTARLVESAAGPDAVVDHVRRQLVGLLGLSGCRFEYGTLIGHPPRLMDDGSIAWGRRHWDADRDGLPREEVELRVSRGGRFHGRFLLQSAPGAAPPLAARLVAVTLANQVGAAYESVSPVRA
ncbi:DUF4118 domain-containing protein [Streptomyces noursei]|uniref:DUF4118 domain-containing protein n=1 Tax=Streptomyces noursei TaxID=1971 RepID=UPI0016741CA4|nr:DUF4118 domain-containing protein [Streptomyces noursei]MCZ1020692.1 DUF4118 domain-containing protein [Streptomyces noursei]GGX38020.1 hypothetical protein GCM10010341_70070 [Streptomyces noursei]